MATGSSELHLVSSASQATSAANLFPECLIYWRLIEILHGEPHFSFIIYVIHFYGFEDIILRRSPQTPQTATGVTAHEERSRATVSTERPASAKALRQEGA